MTPQEVADRINGDTQMLAGLRQYWWDGFAAHNIAEYFQLETGEKPFEGASDNEWILLWWEVQKLVRPKMKELIDQYGEFGKVP